MLGCVELSFNDSNIPAKCALPPNERICSVMGVSLRITAKAVSSKTSKQSGFVSIRNVRSSDEFSGLHFTSTRQDTLLPSLCIPKFRKAQLGGNLPGIAGVPAGSFLSCRRGRRRSQGRFLRFTAHTRCVLNCRGLGCICWCSSSFQPFDIGVGEERAHLGDGDLIQLEQTF